LARPNYNSGAACDPLQLANKLEHHNLFEFYFFKWTSTITFISASNNIIIMLGQTVKLQ
jgi:hypothetical protein